VSVIIAILNQCNANAEEEKKKADDLMKELDKPHDKIRATLMTQLKQIAGDLSAYFDKRPNHEFAQWVVATPLNIERSTKSGEDPLILTMQRVEEDKHIYSNFRRLDLDRKKDQTREKYCDNSCIRQVETLRTKIKKDFRWKKMRPSNLLHTEIQMLYRKDADNIFKQAANKNKVILIYSKYIPCSQNQNSNGGTFVECAGEMAFYAERHNSNGNKFIVFYETQHVAKNKFDNVYVSSVVGVSQLYMEMSGIVAFKYTPEIKTKPGIPNIPSNLQRDPLLVDKAAYFREHPMFIHLGRPLMDTRRKTTVSQLFIDCLARNSFVKTAGNQAGDPYIRFVTLKYFLSELSYNSDELEKFVLDEVKSQSDEQQAVAKGCIVYAKKMSNDRYKSLYIISNSRENNYLNFMGGYPYYADNTHFFYKSQADDCAAYLDTIKKFFKCTTTRQNVCREQCFYTQYDY